MGDKRSENHPKHQHSYSGAAFADVPPPDVPSARNGMSSIRLSVSIAEHNKLLQRKLQGQDLDTERATDPYFAQSGEEFWPAEHATKFQFNSASGKWHMTPIKIRLAKTDFARGGMRASFRAGVIQDNSTVAPCVVKVFKRGQVIQPEVVFHEALTQSVAQSYALAFNKLVQSKGLGTAYEVNFLPVQVLQLHARGAQYYATMEPFLQYPDEYVKLNDNFGRKRNTEAAELAQTFSYFTYIMSKQSLVVCDIQGVGNTYTDPQIHSNDGKLFGAGNLGRDGISRFLSSFQFTKLCAILELPNVHNKGPDEVLQIMQDLGTIVNLKDPDSENHEDPKQKDKPEKMRNPLTKTIHRRLLGRKNNKKEHAQKDKHKREKHGKKVNRFSFRRKKSRENLEETVTANRNTLAENSNLGDSVDALAKSTAQYNLYHLV